jgi:hypothetical protein
LAKKQKKEEKKQRKAGTNEAPAPDAVSPPADQKKDG